MELINILVIILVVCVLECSTMSQDEIEEFTDYLQKTSQLDQTLKSADPDDDLDEDEPASDHAWEESGKFEGDLILNEKQRRLIVEDVAEGLSRNGLRDSTKRWPDNEVIYYIQKEHFSSDQVDAIQNGIDDIARASCVKFRPYKRGDRDAVVIQGSRRGCFSQVGYQGGYQVLNLSGRHPVGRGCFRHGTVVHELLHTLGFYHMQSSPDRDDYIDVIWENIVQPARHNFRKYNTFAVSDFGVGYDYDSVLHYSRRAFSANGQDTIVPKMSGADIGQRIGLSDKDTQKLNKMYCDADSNNFDAEEETTKKPVPKKKTPKNKPFEGHGIGYHQGKTVVIKLLPSAETYQLPDIPEFHLFDYFSKTPEAVPTSQSEDWGKQLKYNIYKPLASISGEYYSSRGKMKLQDHINENPQEENNYNSYEGRTAKNPNLMYKGTEKSLAEENSHLGSTFEDKNLNNSQESTSEEDNQNNSEEIRPEVKNKQDSSSDKLDDDLNDAFQRLGKIIKTHVYPSQTPDLNVYRLNTDYKEFYSPEDTSRKISDKIKKLKGPNYNFSLLPKEIKEKYINQENVNSTALFLKDLYSSKKQNDKKESDILEENQQETLKSTEDDEPTSNNEMDSTYRTSFPLKHEYYAKKKYNTPGYASLANILPKNNYSSLYSPTDKVSDNDTKIHYKVLGKLVPIYNKWYIKDEYKHNPVNYDQNIYSDDLQDKSVSPFSARKSQKIYSPNAEEVYSPTAYLLFGVPVPLTRHWYRIDDAGIPPYNTFDTSKTIGSKKTSENNR
ncbi:uncharacterized protein LOC113522967 isoform X2 [Galleria mellonella]|uniref:Metalloendopeptidase n=1 Tax=Galleria mellonella TaxID=7137 RepID=A0ABM3MR83_GALME|nr:uncharacterized protein LOC113522967 isoform X2 [Galleria mellonella]